MRSRQPLVTATTLVLVLAVACSGAAEETGQGPEQDAGPEAPTAEGGTDGDGETVTITFSDWHLSEEVWAASLEDGFARFAEEHPNIQVEFDTVSYAEKETRYATEIDGGAGPDVMHLHGSILPFASREYLLDLGDLVEQEDGEEFSSQWYEVVMDQLRVDGTLYALPGDFMAMTMFYNSAMLEEAGLSSEDLPETWAEWMTYAEALNAPDDGQWAFGTIGAVDPGFELRVAPVFYSHGARYVDEEGACSALHTPEAREAFAFLVSLVTEEYVPPGVTQQNAGTVREQMANEQIAMAFGTGWTPPIVNALNPELEAFDTLVTAPVPLAEGADPEFPTTAWLSWWAINPNTEHPEEAWEVLKFVTSQEMEQKWFDDNRVLSSRVDTSGARDGDGPEGYDELVNDKFGSVVAEQIPNAQFAPKIPELPEVLEALNVATQQAYTGELDAEAALEQAHSEINSLLGGEGCPDF